MKQPEALSIAEKLDLEWKNDALNYDTAIIAAAELRRLHEANQAMLEAAEDAVDRIKSQLMLLRCDDEFIAHETQKLRVAIAIAKGEQQ